MQRRRLPKGPFSRISTLPRTRPVDPPRVWLDSVNLRVGGDSNAVERGVERGRVLGECTNLARELSNEPANNLTPRVFAERAAGIAREAGLAVEVLDEKRIAELKMGLLLGVAQGSAEPPRLVVLRHEPKSAAAAPVLGLIGKGITFDTGGISIKPAENMDKMKDDMSGGAAVLAAMCAISRLRASVRCIGMIPMTENMPGGKAMKPGDVLTSAEGKTVEVLNTDAEGRLDSRRRRLVRASARRDTPGRRGHAHRRLRRCPRHVRRAACSGRPSCGSSTFAVPVSGPAIGAGRCRSIDDYKELFKSEIADFANTGGRAGGAITAALFIKEFTGDLPWAHLDIAGTAWVEDAKPYLPKGPTGVGVRTLAELALGVDEWGKL